MKPAGIAAAPFARLGEPPSEDDLAAARDRKQSARAKAAPQQEGVSKVSFDFSDWLAAGLAGASYLEDVAALEHFVMHPRLNGSSNACILCKNYTDMDSAESIASAPHDNNGHLADCEYIIAIRRLATGERLRDYSNRK
jgi:hypothetical protein